VGGNITTGGKGTLLEGVTSGIGWTWVVAAAFVLAVVLWQGWRDVGLDRLPEARNLKLTWLPMIYIVGGLVLAAVFGLPSAAVLLLILIATLLVGSSEELMLRGVMLQAFRHVATAAWYRSKPPVRPTRDWPQSRGRDPAREGAHSCM
jgi:membrane protease YdiL (CAAX protease family)